MTEQAATEVDTKLVEEPWTVVDNQAEEPTTQELVEEAMTHATKDAMNDSTEEAMIEPTEETMNDPAEEAMTEPTEEASAEEAVTEEPMDPVVDHGEEAKTDSAEEAMTEPTEEASAEEAVTEEPRVPVVDQGEEAKTDSAEEAMIEEPVLDQVEEAMTEPVEEPMESPRRHELDQLEAIGKQVTDVQTRISERLPTQWKHLTALVCALKWVLEYKQRKDALTQEEVDQVLKRVRMELGAFNYAAGEQAEILTRNLLELDNIFSNGDEAVKTARKALVIRIQDALEVADKMKVTATHLKEFGDRMITLRAWMPTQPEDVDMAEDTSATCGVDATSHEATVDSEPMQDDNEREDEAEEEEDNEEDPDEEDEDEDHNNSDWWTADRETAALVRSLPEWSPRCQMMRGRDGVDFLVHLGNVDPRNVAVRWVPTTHTLEVSGFKFPTQSDLLMARYRGVQTFGRFHIAHQFATDALDMSQADRELTRDGLLCIHIPFRAVRYPPFMGGFPLGSRCMVW